MMNVQSKRVIGIWRYQLKINEFKSIWKLISRFNTSMDV